MSVIIVKGGKLADEEDRNYYRVKCVECDAIYAFDDSDVITECRDILSPYMPYGGTTQVKKEIICPCCNRVTFYQDFEKITMEDYYEYICDSGVSKPRKINGGDRLL